MLVDAPSGHHTRVPPGFVEREGWPEEEPGALYDLRDDLGQRRDVSAEHPERVAELRALLARVREQRGTAPRSR